MSILVTFYMQRSNALVVLPWPPMARSLRADKSSGFVQGAKPVVSHSWPRLTHAQPLLLVEHFHPGGVWVGTRPVFVSLALELSENGTAVPEAPIHCISVIHSCLLLICFKLLTSIMLIKTLDDWLALTTKSDPSALYTWLGVYWCSNKSVVVTSSQLLTPSRLANWSPQNRSALSTC